MERSTALGAAGGITLAVAGAVTAIVMTAGNSAGADPQPVQVPEPEIVTEFVDEHGNPVADPSTIEPIDATPASPPPAPVIEVVDSATGEPVPTVLHSDDVMETAPPIAPPQPAAVPSATSGSLAQYSETEDDAETEYETGEYDDEEYTKTEQYAADDEEYADDQTEEYDDDETEEYDDDETEEHSDEEEYDDEDDEDDD